LHHSFCLVGNSSCGIREAYALRKYVIDIGTRQKNRERSENVFNVDHDRQGILSTLQHIRENIEIFPEILPIYGNGNSSKKMVKILEDICLDGKINKRLKYEN
jgi:UDP-N-acetylglucosamine 2-epimerase